MAVDLFDALMAALFGFSLAICLMAGYEIGVRECRAFLASQPPFCPPPDAVFEVTVYGERQVGKFWRDPGVARVCG